jgi:hypothetical protein
MTFDPTAYLGWRLLFAAAAIQAVAWYWLADHFIGWAP